MILQSLDIAIILGFMALTLIIGLIVSRGAASDSESFFLGNSTHAVVVARHFNGRNDILYRYSESRYRHRQDAGCCR